jgi:hypothetical protein
MKLFRLGILFIAISIIGFLVFFFNDGFLYYKFFHRHSKSDKTLAYVIAFPIVQEDGTVACERPNNFESKIFILSSDQVISYKKIGSVNEPSYRFTSKVFFLDDKNGNLTINNDNDEIKIKMYLPRMDHLRNYLGEYELTDNNLILVNASYDSLSPFSLLLLTGLILFPFFIGFVFTISGLIQIISLKRKAVVSQEPIQLQ